MGANKISIIGCPRCNGTGFRKHNRLCLKCWGGGAIAVPTASKKLAEKIMHSDKFINEVLLAPSPEPRRRKRK